ncbi:AIR synthase related protein, partial [Klebsiella pneumoniae]|nr:AIR synthase related protein [Klebsiella pneumoniae]
GANKNLGYLAINISVNDVSCQGADPVGVLISILLPAESKLEDLNKIMEDADRACRQNNLEIIGGHTEVTDAVNKIVL